MPQLFPLKYLSRRMLRSYVFSSRNFEWFRYVVIKNGQAHRLGEPIGQSVTVQTNLYAHGPIIMSKRAENYKKEAARDSWILLRGVVDGWRP